MQGKILPASLVSLCLVTGIILSGCAGGGSPSTAPQGAAQGDSAAGKQLIVQKGCSGCHVVPGVPEAKGSVGPNLGGLASRPTIAGVLPNNQENMTKWLKNPPAVKPGTQMPTLGLSDQEITNLAAFLSTLK